LKDINTSPDFGDPGKTSDSASFLRPVPLGKRLYFIADDGAHGWELWSTNGREKGTELVKDIRQTWPEVGAFSLVEASGKLILAASDGTTGLEPWRSDGTAAGTFLLRDIRPGASDAWPSQLTVSNGLAFFIADDGVHGGALWRTDGTTAGTVLLATFDPDPLGHPPWGLVDLNGVLYFTAHTTGHGRELWRSDGTEVGTSLAADLTAESGSTRFSKIFVALGSLFLIIDDGIHGRELWKSDGTKEGTHLVKDIEPAPEGLGVLGAVECNQRLFLATDSGLWKTDGTEGGTALVKFGIVFDFDIACAGETLYFRAVDAWPGHGWELWKSDGTAEGTVLVKDINPGPVPSYPSHFFPVGDHLLFSAGDETHGSELWRSDGTEEGTVLVQDIAASATSSGPPGWGSGPRAFTPLGKHTLFFADNGATGQEPWIGRTAILLGQPHDALRELRDEVRGLRLARVVQRSLISRLDTAARELSVGDRGDAVDALVDFMRRIPVHTPGRIPPGPAEELLSFAQDLIDLLEEP